MKLAALLLFVLIAQILAHGPITFSGNVSVNAAGVTMAEYKYRATSVWTIPISLPPFGSFTLAAYASAEVSASGTNTSGQVSGDLIVGAIKFYSGIVPVSFMGYINAQINANRNVDSVSNSDVTSFNYTAAAGFILTAYAKIEERGPAGAVVRSIELKNLVWDVAAGNSSGGLHYIKLHASNNINPLTPNLHNLLKTGESIGMTFLISEVLGEVTFESVTTAVTPKSLESIIDINGWTYVTTANHLVLVCGVATGAAAGSSAGMVTVSSGSGANQVYAHFDGHVDVSGTKKSVTVTATKTSNFGLITDDADIQATASSVYKGQFNLQVVEIAFPAGADKITYDPTIGSGTPLASSAQTTLLFALFLAIIVLLI